MPRVEVARELVAMRGLLTRGRYAEALTAAGELTQRFPRQASVWKMLGEALLKAGDGHAALSASRRAAELSPADFETFFQIGSIAQTLGQLGDAELAYRRALRLRPKHAAAHQALGRILLLRRQTAEAEHCLRLALQARPNCAETHAILGDVLLTVGRMAEAERCYCRALQLQPELFRAHNNLGNLYQLQGSLPEARRCFERACQLQSESFEPHNNLGNVLLAMGLLGEAERSLQQALRLKPELAELHNNLGNIQWAQGKVSMAGARYQRAVQLNPSYAQAQNSLGIFHQALGRCSEAESCFRQALKVKPDYAEAHSNLLLSLNYREDLSKEIVFDAHRQYGARFGSAYEPQWPEHSPRLRGTPGNRPLRVGYVSPDFHQHSVAQFVLPLLRAHDPRSVEIYCYADVVRPDAVTATLQQLAAHWIDTVGLTDGGLADRIVADEIDVLVDLAGHTAGNRLPAFARKPAPVQITWLGYPNTTGLPGMDYRLVDAVTDPPGDADRAATEMLIRLDRGFLCFEPPAQAPPPQVPPCLESQVFTFGSFNNPAKLSPRVLDAWVQILARVPHSRLLLKGGGLGEDSTREEFLSRFCERGADVTRIRLLGKTEKLLDHLAVYGQVDLALDSFPYNGTTTTCEALWMGVPVVTLLGDRHAARVAASLLTQIGLGELIADSVERYIELACEFAQNVESLRSLRLSLRELMRAAPLCDAQDFARKMEATYQRLWRRACECSGVAASRVAAAEAVR